jgi:hypothetical protein
LIYNRLGFNLSSRKGNQTFPGKFIDDIQYLERTSISRAIHHEIITPDVVFMLRPQTDTGAVIEP